MRKIYIFDTTLRDGEQSPGVNLNTQEKVEIALQLEKLGVDRIEAGFPAASPGDLAAVNAVAKAVQECDCNWACPVRESRTSMRFAKRLRCSGPVLHFSWQHRLFIASISCGWRSSRYWKQQKLQSGMLRNTFTKLNSPLRMQVVRS